MWIEKLIEFIKEEEGQSVVEYSLLLTLIGASTVFMLTLLGFSVSRAIGMQDITVEQYTRWAFEKFSAR
ncbi:MAG: Flp family type IVb pilin [Acidobacteria bacterium]|nr:Flp family type IVb pilin [Acidobacteriota bacterium]